MDFLMFKVERKFKWFGRLWEIVDDQDRLIYEAKTNFLSKHAEIRSLDGRSSLVIQKKNAWFKWKYEIYRNASLLSTFVTKNKKFKPTFLFDDDGRHITASSSRFMKEITYTNDGQEIAKASRVFKFKGNSYGIAIRADYDPELFLASVIIIDIIRNIKKRRKAG